jgi:hypothetical protein
MNFLQRVDLLPLFFFFLGHSKYITPAQSLRIVWFWKFSSIHEISLFLTKRLRNLLALRYSHFPPLTVFLEGHARIEFATSRLDSRQSWYLNHDG